MNPLFSKLISLILVVLILFSIFRYIYLDYSTYQKNNPYLVEYDKSLSQLTEISNNKFNVSEDQRGGLEFTYAFWLNLTDTNNIIFKKGTNDNQKLELKAQSQNMGTGEDSGDFSIPDNSNKLIYLKLRVPIYKADNNYKCLNYRNERDCLAPCHWNDEDKCEMSKCADLNATYRYNIIPGEDDTSEVEPSGEQTTSDNTRLALGRCESYEFCRLNSESLCEDREYHDLIIQNIPYQKWFHLSLIFINKYVDVYINGNLYNRFELANIIRQNNSNLEFGKNNSSRIMRFQYFNYALPSYKIQSLVSNTDIRSQPKENEYIEGNIFNNKYWVKDNLSKIYDN